MIMGRVVRVKRGNGKHLVKMIRRCYEQDIIFLPPGKYVLPDQLHIRKSLDIVGIGKNPQDVIIEGSISVREVDHIRFSNLTFQPVHAHDQLVFQSVGDGKLNKLIVKGNQSRKTASVLLIDSMVDVYKSEFLTDTKDGFSLIVRKRSNINFNLSIADSIYINHSQLEIEKSQVQKLLYLTNNGIVSSNSFVDFPSRLPNKYYIFLEEDSRLYMKEVVAHHLLNIKLLNSDIKIDDIRIDETDIVDVDFEDDCQIDLPELNNINIEQLRQRVKETNRQNVAASKEDKQTEEDTSSEHETEAPGQEKKEKQASKTNALEQLMNMYGLKTLKKQVKDFIHTAKYNKMREEQNLSRVGMSLHSLFLGNPGTGKTTVARLLGQILYENGVVEKETFIEVTRKDLVGEHIGGTAQKTNEILEKSKGGVLFIDEAYALYQDSERDFGHEAIDTLITFMEDHRDDTMIIFAGYTDEMTNFINMNSGLRSRIPNNFDFDDYLPDEIAEIGYDAIVADDYIVDETYYKDVIARLYERSLDESNARWVRNINEQLIRAVAQRVIKSGTSDTQTILKEDFKAITDIDEVDQEEQVDKILAELDQYIGLEEVKSHVNDLIKRAKVDQAMIERGIGVDQPTYHMTFTGNPGTGKTSIANILARLFYYIDILPTTNVKVVDRADLVGEYIGHTEKQTKQVIEQALGGVLFIDEAYQLSSHSKQDFGHQAIETLLTYLEDYRENFIVILAGYTDEMETFLDANPGLRSRIPLNIEFPDYTAEEVAEITKSIITKHFKVDDDLLRKVVVHLYEKLPTKEKANGRWARNFAEQVIHRHKVWLSDNDALDKIEEINSEVLQSFLEKVKG